MTITILGKGVATITVVPPTIVSARLSRARIEEIANHEISATTTKVQRKNDTRIIVASITISPVTIGVSAISGRTDDTYGVGGTPSCQKR